MRSVIKFFRKQFGERRGDGFEVRARGDEVDVSLHGVARGGKNAVALQGLFARKPGGFDQPQPLLDAAGSCAVAIVIEDALAPRQAKGRIFAAREDRGVFDGDAALIVVAIERPGLQLAAREFAFVHQRMKWMLVVIALFADGVKAGDEVGFREQRLLVDVLGLGASQFEFHSIIGDFPAGITHGAVFGAVFIQDRIGVVDVNEDAAGFRRPKGLAQQTAVAP